MSLATNRLPMMRSEISSNFDSGETSTLLSMRYDPGKSGDERLKPGLNTEANSSAYPLVIYDYKIEFATDTLATIYQVYCNYDETPGELSGYTDWNMQSRNFQSSLKQHKFVAGSQTAVSPAEGTLIDKSLWKQGTLYYKAKGYYSKRHKEWRWIRPPIVLSRNRKNFFGLYAANVGNTDDRSFFGLVTIKKWHQML